MSIRGDQGTDETEEQKKAAKENLDTDKLVEIVNITDGDRNFMNGMRGKIRTFDAYSKEYTVKMEGGG